MRITSDSTTNRILRNVLARCTASGSGSRAATDRHMFANAVENAVNERFVDVLGAATVPGQPDAVEHLKPTIKREELAEAPLAKVAAVDVAHKPLVSNMQPSAAAPCVCLHGRHAHTGQTSKDSRRQEAQSRGMPAHLHCS